MKQNTKTSLLLQTCQSVEKGHSKEWLFCMIYGIIEVEKRQAVKVC